MPPAEDGAHVYSGSITSYARLCPSMYVSCEFCQRCVVDEGPCHSAVSLLPTRVSIDASVRQPSLDGRSKGFIPSDALGILVQGSQPTVLLYGFVGEVSTATDDL